MFDFVTFNLQPIWHVLTRLGEAEILLPTAALAALALLVQAQTRQLGFAWLSLLGVAALVTTATKVAFIGWGMGWATINFTGISGHTMFATAIYPVLLMTLVPNRSWRNFRWSTVLGLAMAILVGVSRVKVEAHSWSEVFAGWILGGAVSAIALVTFERPNVSIRPALLAILAVWLAVMPFQLRASNTHSLVTRLALKMSNRETPFRRVDLLKGTRQRAEQQQKIGMDMAGESGRDAAI
jgi:membrane-associated phospholipid phosphatase